MELIAQVDIETDRHRSMLFWEGATLLALLLIGGGTLIHFIRQESRHARKLKKFFAGFTHDVKTRLAGVKLQTEILRADNKDEKLKSLIDRLLTDTSRLQVQVENSLYVGGSSRNTLHAESVSIRSLVEILKDSWPQLHMTVRGEATVLADRRAIESVLTNLFHNSISHGQATEIEVDLSVDRSEGCAQIRVRDNGKGFSGDATKLGEIFYRHNPSSGSGLGLYTSRESIQKMGGSLLFRDAEKKGFQVEIQLPVARGDG